MMAIEQLGSWIGKTESVTDRLTDERLAGLAATLDHPFDRVPWPPGQLPPLGHWLYFLPHVEQHNMAEDGHPRRGTFLPPVDLPRRMWAGGALQFHAPVARDALLRRRSTIASIERKSGSTGELIFVTVDHTYALEAPDGAPEAVSRPAAADPAGGNILITERQDIVYREAPAGAANASTTPASTAIPPSAAPQDMPCDWIRDVVPDPVLLFRFSALTFNAHKIHYDRDYCRNVEGYPGLVVHGPLCATLLMDLYLRHHPGAEIASFRFKARRPLFDTQPFQVCGKATPRGADLWIRDSNGEHTMHATLEAR